MTELCRGNVANKWSHANTSPGISWWPLEAEIWFNIAIELQLNYSAFCVLIFNFSPGIPIPWSGNEFGGIMPPPIPMAAALLPLASNCGGRFLGISIPFSFKFISLHATENSLRSIFPSPFMSANPLMKLSCLYLKYISRHLLTKFVPRPWEEVRTAWRSPGPELQWWSRPWARPWWTVPCAASAPGEGSPTDPWFLILSLNSDAKYLQCYIIISSFQQQTQHNDIICISNLQWRQPVQNSIVNSCTRL